MPLPTSKHTPSLDPERAKVLLFGRAKIGKTTCASKINPDETLFIATEPGYGAISAYVAECKSWPEFKSIVTDLAKGDHKFKTVVIDTIDELYKQCVEFKTKELRIQHPGDLEYGKGWQMVTDQFRAGIGSLALLDVGLWMISHDKETEIKERTGAVTTKVGPSISGKAGEFILGFVDFILYAESVTTEKGEERVLRTKPTEKYEVGGRVPLPDPIPLDGTVLAKEMRKAAAGLKAPSKTSKEADQTQIKETVNA